MVWSKAPSSMPSISAMMMRPRPRCVFCSMSHPPITLGSTLSTGLSHGFGSPTTLRPMNTRAEIGVIGGSGFYSLLDDAEEVSVSTPYGEPSDVVTVGTIGGGAGAFIAGHGRGVQFRPQRIPYRGMV